MALLAHCTNSKVQVLDLCRQRNWLAKDSPIWVINIIWFILSTISSHKIIRIYQVLNEAEAPPSLGLPLGKS